MCNLKLNKHELEMLILWARCYQDEAKKLGIPFECDELALVEKLRKCRKGG